jgi:hypothetical protein
MQPFGQANAPLVARLLVALRRANVFLLLEMPRARR